MLRTITRSRAAHIFLGILFLWSLLPLQPAIGSYDPGRADQREVFTQAQACPLPVVTDHRGKHSGDQQLQALTRASQDALEAFERTMTAERATAIRAFTPLPVHVVYTQHTSSDL